MGYFDVIQLDPKWQKIFTCSAGHELPGDPIHAESGWQTKALWTLRDSEYNPGVYLLDASGLLLRLRDLYGVDGTTEARDGELGTPTTWTSPEDDPTDIYTDCDECEKVHGRQYPLITWYLVFRDGRLTQYGNWFDDGELTVKR